MKKFWDKEYKRSARRGGGPTHLSLSTEPAEDLQKFVRWLGRQSGAAILHQNATVLDLGCGNGRNLIYLAREFGVKGIGYDSSTEAIKLARSAALGRSLVFETGSVSEPLPLPDQSVNLVLDMMTSHILRAAEREQLRAEIYRVLKPGGWLFFKTFLLEEDINARRMIHDYPSDEPHSYIHPELKHFEHVWTVSEIEEFFSPYFIVHRIDKSHKHISHGHAFRRRTVSVYLEKLG